jgi:hypothetical protein
MKEKLRLKIRKTHRQYKTQRTSYKTNGSLYASYASDCSLKLKIRKIKDLSPKGYRIINLDCLQSHISDITLHVCLCPDANCLWVFLILSLNFSFLRCFDFVMVYIGLPKYLFCLIFLCLPKLWPNTLLILVFLPILI